MIVAAQNFGQQTAAQILPPKIPREKNCGPKALKFFSSPSRSNRCDGRAGATVEQVQQSKTNLDPLL